MPRVVVIKILAVLGSVGLLAACGSNNYCLVKKEYQQARVVPELRSAEGLTMPNSPSALRLPPAPTNPEPFGTKDSEGEGMCLDKPPAMAQPAAQEPETKQQPAT
jgi:hypothetical protein